MENVQHNTYVHSLYTCCDIVFRLNNEVQSLFQDVEILLKLQIYFKSLMTQYTKLLTELGEKLDNIYQKKLINPAQNLFVCTQKLRDFVLFIKAVWKRLRRYLEYEVKQVRYCSFKRGTPLLPVVEQLVDFSFQFSLVCKKGATHSYCTSQFNKLSSQLNDLIYPEVEFCDDFEHNFLYAKTSIPCLINLITIVDLFTYTSQYDCVDALCNDFLYEQNIDTSQQTTRHLDIIGCVDMLSSSETESAPTLKVLLSHVANMTMYVLKMSSVRRQRRFSCPRLVGILNSPYAGSTQAEGGIARLGRLNRNNVAVDNRLKVEVKRRGRRRSSYGRTIREENKNTFFLEMKPALLILRALGRFPYKLTDTGPAPFSVLSLPAFYSLLAYVGFGALTAWSTHRILTEKVYNAGAFDEFIFWSLLMMFSMQTYLIPLTYWWDSPKIVSYLHKWKEFEEFIRSDGLGLRGFRVVRLLSYSTFPFTIVYILVEMYFLSDITPLVFIQYVPIIAAQSTLLTIWCGTLYELAGVSGNLVPRIEQAFSKHDLEYRRQISLKINYLVKELGYAPGKTMLLSSIVTFASFVMCIYGVLADSNSTQKDKTTYTTTFFGLLIGACLCSSLNYVCCEAAHLATQKIGNDFNTKVLQIDITLRPQAFITEMELLLKGVTSIPPIVEYNGFVKVDRQLFSHFLGEAVTYLIVLVQFKEITLPSDTAG